MGIVYLNGKLQPLAEARVSPMDRGFLFGDGAYEVIPVYGGRPFRLGEHLARLAQTLSGIGLANPHTDAEWAAIVDQLIATEAAADQAIYLQITRGEAPLREQAFPTPPLAPTVFGYASALKTPGPDQRAQGVAAYSMQDIRWLRCDLKTLNLLANCLLRQAAVARGGAEAILLRDGWLTEGAASNIFIVRGGLLLAPPKSQLMLPGITYDLVLELARAHGLPHEVRPIAAAELKSADEIWITSSAREVLAVTRLDDQPVGDGRPGPVCAQMYAWYQAYKDSLRSGDRT
ncbi:MAG: D-amino acid aminotransferase [Rhodocyclaceae bacterium]|nr:D-amino acid aminotransferase [Rhodocyclaceae bacterium]MBX3666818.1 D-amino acid aminotransferase [Rhodocyclaceae bacterium]